VLRDKRFLCFGTDGFRHDNYARNVCGAICVNVARDRPRWDFIGRLLGEERLCEDYKTRKPGVTLHLILRAGLTSVICSGLNCVNFATGDASPHVRKRIILIVA